MAWKTEIPYQNANSPLWTEPLWFSLSVPRWLHFPTKLVSAPLPPPLLLPPPPVPPFSFPHVFLKAEICFSSAGSRANRLSFPCQRKNLKQPCALYLATRAFEMYFSSVVAARLYLRSWPVGGHWTKMGFVVGVWWEMHSDFTFKTGVYCYIGMITCV